MVNSGPENQGNMPPPDYRPNPLGVIADVEGARIRMDRFRTDRGDANKDNLAQAQESGDWERQHYVEVQRERVGQGFYDQPRNVIRCNGVGDNFRSGRYNIDQTIKEMRNGEFGGLADLAAGLVGPQDLARAYREEGRRKTRPTSHQEDQREGDRGRREHRNVMRDKRVVGMSDAERAEEIQREIQRRQMEMRGEEVPDYLKPRPDYYREYREMVEMDYLADPKRMWEYLIVAMMNGEESAQAEQQEMRFVMKTRHLINDEMRAYYQAPHSWLAVIQAKWAQHWEGLADREATALRSSELLQSFSRFHIPFIVEKGHWEIRRQTVRGKEEMVRVWAVDEQRLVKWRFADAINIVKSRPDIRERWLSHDTDVRWRGEDLIGEMLCKKIGLDPDKFSPNTTRIYGLYVAPGNTEVAATFRGIKSADLTPEHLRPLMDENGLVKQDYLMPFMGDRLPRKRYKNETFDHWYETNGIVNKDQLLSSTVFLGVGMEALIMAHGGIAGLDPGIEGRQIYAERRILLLNRYLHMQTILNPWLRAAAQLGYKSMWGENAYALYEPLRAMRVDRPADVMQYWGGGIGCG